MKKFCKKAKETRDTANSASSGTLQGWRRASRNRCTSEKSRFFQKDTFFSQNTVRRCLVGAGLSGSLSCCHFLCDLSRGPLTFAFYTLSHFLVLSRCSLLRRDPRTSFFALFSEGFSDPRVYRYHMETRSGEAFFATSKKCVQKLL